MCPEWKKTRLHPGGLAEYVRVEAAAVATDTLRLPDALSFEDGALVEPLACAVKAVRRARVVAGDSVAVIGLGSNGILLGLASRNRRARRRSSAATPIPRGERTRVDWASMRRESPEEIFPRR